MLYVDEIQREAKLSLREPFGLRFAFNLCERDLIIKNQEYFDDHTIA